MRGEAILPRQPEEMRQRKGGQMGGGIQHYAAMHELAEAAALAVGTMLVSVVPAAAAVVTPVRRMSVMMTHVVVPECRR